MDKVTEISELIKKNYKRSEVHTISLSGDYLVLDCTFQRENSFPFVALRILNKYPEIRVIHFTGGWVEGVYTRNTLNYAGYKVK